MVANVFGLLNTKENRHEESCEQGGFRRPPRRDDGTQADGEKYQRAYFVDSSQTPKELSIFEAKKLITGLPFAAPSGKRGTYALGKNDLTVYLPADGKDLPKDLGEKTEGLNVIVFRRVEK